VRRRETKEADDGLRRPGSNACPRSDHVQLDLNAVDNDLASVFGVAALGDFDASIQSVGRQTRHFWFVDDSRVGP
jgi:hypothetical protein